MGTDGRDEASSDADASTVIGVVGLGYVGLPLAIAMAESGFRTIGFDLSEEIVAALQAGRSHILDVPDVTIAGAMSRGFSVSTDLGGLGSCDAIIICVPTPLNQLKDPDLTYVLAAADAVRRMLRPGQLVILESTTYPGTTRDVLLPILEESELVAGSDFFLCFSPERVDPGNPTWRIRNTPKLLGGVTDACLETGLALYRQVFETVVPVTSTEVAELAKIYENTFRMVNIALANELAQACAALGLDVLEVIEAAATKPFGFMKFVPGPGLGGHCIPLDPLYLSWKMSTLSFTTRLIELASDINTEMPGWVVQQVGDALNDRGKPIHGSQVLVLGVAYKRDVADYRESPAIEIMTLLREKGAHVTFHDPFCPVIEETTLPPATARGVELTAGLLAATDAVLIVTDHSDVDYQRVADNAPLVIDTRGVMRGVTGKALVIGLSGQVSQNGIPSAKVPVTA